MWKSWSRHTYTYDPMGSKFKALGVPKSFGGNSRKFKCDFAFAVNELTNI